MIAALVGGTGLTGSYLLRRLLDDSAITAVVSVARRSSSIPHAKLQEIVVPDLGELPAMASSVRADLFFCCLGTTIRTAGSEQNFERVDHGAVLAFAAIARARGAQAFTHVSAMGADARSRFFYNQIKGRTEDDLTALGLRSLTIFRPGLLVGPRREFRLAERLSIGVLAPLAFVLPRVHKSLVTNAETLAVRMLAEGKAATPGVHIVAAKDI